jgi:glycosyltransferase involved in cell wall biosynthesis
MRAPKLLFLETEDWQFVSHRLPLAVAAHQVGYEVTVVARIGEHGHTIRDAGLQLIPIELSLRGKNPFSAMRLVTRLIAIYRRERPDIVHHLAIKPMLYGSLAARFVGVRHVVNTLSGLGWLFTSESRLANVLGRGVRFAFRKLLNRGAVIVQNPDDMKWLRDLGIASSHLHLIRGSGVEVNRFAPTPEPDDGEPVVVLASRMLWHKGVGEFVAAARHLKQRGIAARFVLAGDRDPANPASIPPGLLESWHAEGVIEWWGHRNDMAQVFAQSHLVCLPSYYREGLPKVLLEAAACGRAIVTTDMPGCREIVSHGDNGLLVSPHDEVALADALQTLLLDPERRSRMGTRGRARVVQEFAVDKVVAETLALYRGLLPQ